MLLQLIIVNIAIFLILNVFRLIFFFQGYTEINLDIVFFKRVLQWVAMPERFDEFIYKPWTVFTYMFIQVDVLHVFFNMLMLFLFGRLMQQLMGNGRILAIYIYGGLMGAVLTIIFHSTIPVLYLNSGPLLGASGSVMAIVIATITYAPNMRVMLLLFGEIRLIYLGLIYVVIDLVGISYADGTGHICHLGGALMGFLFVKAMQNGRDLSRAFNKGFYALTGLFKAKKPRMKVVKTSASVRTGHLQAGAGQSKAQVRERIDAILDKISKGGYESLSKEEKDYLYRYGKDV
ncbi:MAG TPA: rhomboid family intramembrane serine protease [Flavobacteriales bacterium]|nr:rhomboid family intramembrane serine protease [Flavobacteriales bacterium]